MASLLKKFVYATDKSTFNLTIQKLKQETDLILHKGAYPYEYIDSQERFKETVLPPKEAFYSKVSDETISQKDYDHGSHSTIKHLAIIMTCNVVLLADVFQTFHKTCMDAYKLDHLHYYTATGLSWAALLKQTKIDFFFVCLFGA